MEETAASVTPRVVGRDPRFAQQPSPWAAQFHRKSARSANWDDATTFVDEEVDDRPVDDIANLPRIAGLSSDSFRRLSGPGDIRTDPTSATADGKTTNPVSARPPVRVGGLLYGVYEAWRTHGGIAMSPGALWYTL